MIRVYEVHFIIRVDRPELRGPTLPVVSPDHRIRCVERYESQGAAVRRFDAMCAGKEDYPSEFVSCLHVVAVDKVIERYDHFGPVYATRRIRTVRKSVDRTWFDGKRTVRREDTATHRREMLRVAAARKSSALHFIYFPAWQIEARCERMNRRDGYVAAA